MDTKIAKNRFKNIMSQKIYTQRSLSLILLIFLIILVFSFLLNNFFTFGNLSITLLALSSKVIIGIGITFILVSGLVDLSIGSTFGLCGAITAFLIIRNIPIFFAVIIGLCTGAFIGLLNGLIVEKLHVNSIIATLAMLGIVRGVVVFIAEQPIAFLPQQFTVIGQKVILGLQSPIWIMLILMVIFSPLLTKHRFFRQFYFIGSNPKTALLSGIRVSRLRIINFIIVGIFAGAAGIVYTARVGSATAVSGSGLELKVIAAAIIGGCSLSGGEGTILGTFLGVVLMELILDVLVFAKVSTYWQDIITGLVLIFAVSIDYFIKSGGRRKAIN